MLPSFKLTVCKLTVSKDSGLYVKPKLSLDHVFSSGQEMPVVKKKPRVLVLIQIRYVSAVFYFKM